jgi:hypothetical protein
MLSILIWKEIQKKLVVLKSDDMGYFHIEGHVPLFKTISQKEFHPSLDVV